MEEDRRIPLPNTLVLNISVPLNKIVRNVVEIMNAKKPHFLEIYLPNLSSQRLEVPSKFIKHLKGRTSGSLSLIGPSGNSWHVDLIDQNGHLFFNSGWPTFVNDHSLQCGDSLVFRYDGNSRFTIQIFDESSCEKEEALKARCSQRSINCNGNLGKKRGRDKEAYLSNLDGERKHRETLIPVHLDLPDGDRDKDLETCLTEDDDLSGTKELNVSDPVVLALPCSSNTIWNADILKSEKKKAVNKKQNAQINASLSKFIESRAAEYITSSSPYFVRVMNYSNIDGNGTMKIPIKFSAQHLPDYRTKITLKNVNGDCWLINCIPTVRKSSTMHTFCGGWLAFARGNGLKIEDVCIFELVDKLEMLVRILKLGVEGLENQTGNSSFDACNIEMSGCPLESAINVTGDICGDQFLEESDQLNDLFINDNEGHRENTEIFPTIQQNATVVFDTSDSAISQKSRIGCDLSPFSEAFDECTDAFLMCSAEETHLNETTRDNDVDFEAGETTNKQATCGESPSLTFTSPFPSFMKVMANSNVSGSFTLAVPRTFSAAHLPSHKSNIVLRNMQGHSWNVVSTCNGQQTKLCGGWMSFVRKNGIKVGDACIFELVEDKVLQVRVFEGGHKGEEHQSDDVADSSTL
ncbi:hypothetical protein KSS87_001589 [Heliosperma pusillum]|nr:hypothetical protein KSS87_001589 [Heliosperma pusillum]